MHNDHMAMIAFNSNSIRACLQCVNDENNEDNAPILVLWRFPARSQHEDNEMLRALRVDTPHVPVPGEAPGFVPISSVTFTSGVLWTREGMSGSKHSKLFFSEMPLPMK
jgi:hypothetical protein